VLFGKKTTDLTTSQLAEREASGDAGGGATAVPRPSGKGRPTPRRRDAEAANRRPLVVDRKAMSAEQKAKVRAERARVRQAMLAGEERYLPFRDQGPERRYLRDAVDRHRSVGEILLPVMLLVLAISLLPFDVARVSTFLAAYALMLFAVVDCWLLWRRTKKRFVAEFGKEPGRGSAWYVVIRAFQMRGSRVPRPGVERGSELRRR
jgi:hypothetical protein